MVGAALLGDTIAVNQPDLLAVSEAIEALLAANNHRGMDRVRASLTPGICCAPRRPFELARGECIF